MNCDLRRLVRVVAVAAWLTLLWGGRPAMAESPAADTSAAAAEVARLRHDLRQLAREVARLQAADERGRERIAGLSSDVTELRRTGESLRFEADALRAQLDEQSRFGPVLNRLQSYLSSLRGELRVRELLTGALLAALALAGIVLLLVARRLALKRRAEEALALTRAAEREHALVHMLRRLLALPAARTDDGLDRDFAVNVADEVQRMANRIATFPPELPGLAALQRALERLRTALAARGYEMQTLDGMPYHDGLTVTAQFVPAPGLPAGERRIVRTVRPQVKHRDRIIRPAEVEVGIGEGGSSHEPRQD